MNRREATQCLMGASVSAAARAADWTSAAIASGGASAAGLANPTAKAPFSVVIMDDRYDITRRFAEALASDGTACLATLGEAIHVWHNQCRPRLPAHAWRIAALTTYCDFMLLHDCARSVGGRVVHVGQHDCRNSGTIVHEVSAGARAERLTNALRQADWAHHMAQALARAPLDPMQGNERTVRIEVSTPRTDRPGTLMSWVIAGPGGTSRR